jgi:hypothetical protein
MTADLSQPKSTVDFIFGLLRSAFGLFFDIRGLIWRPEGLDRMTELFLPPNTPSPPGGGPWAGLGSLDQAWEIGHNA